MRTNRGWALAAAVLCAVPAAAQDRGCADGRGMLVPDLGFERLSRATAAGEPAVVGVRRAGPAAGRLRDGDRVVAVQGAAMSTGEGRRRFFQIRDGEPVRLSIRRAGRVEDVTVVAGQRCIPLAPDAPPAPVAPAAPSAPAAPLPPAGELMPAAWLGFVVQCDQCGDEGSGFRFREPPVVASVEPGSQAARAGLRPGDRLTHVAGTPLTGEGGWPRFSAIVPGQEVAFTFARDGQPLQVTVSALAPR